MFVLRDTTGNRCARHDTSEVEGACSFIFMSRVTQMRVDETYDWLTHNR